jgi:hypothetical protein
MATQFDGAQSNGARRRSMAATAVNPLWKGDVAGATSML